MIDGKLVFLRPADGTARLVFGDFLPPTAATGIFKARVDGAWVPGLLKYREAGAWVTKPLKMYTAGDWVTLASP